MGARAETMAGRFDEKFRQMNTVVEGLSDADWKKVTAAEKWPVGVVAHHLAMAYGSVVGLVQLAAQGQPVPHRTMDMVHERNAQHAKEHAGVGKAETLTLLKAKWRQCRQDRPGGSAMPSWTEAQRSWPACRP